MVDGMTVSAELLLFMEWIWRGAGVGPGKRAFILQQLHSTLRIFSNLAGVKSLRVKIRILAAAAALIYYVLGVVGVPVYAQGTVISPIDATQTVIWVVVAVCVVLIIFATGVLLRFGVGALSVWSQNSSVQQAINMFDNVINGYYELTQSVTEATTINAVIDSALEALTSTNPVERAAAANRLRASLAKRRH
jgi:hypothetical protein